LWFKALCGVVRRELHAVPVRVVNMSTECQPADKKEVFLTPGTGAGQLSPSGATASRHWRWHTDRVTSFHQYNHRAILSARAFRFEWLLIDAPNEYLQLHGSFCCPDVVHRFRQPRWRDKRDRTFGFNVGTSLSIFRLTNSSVTFGAACS
jgi:hypothetical protein